MNGVSLPPAQPAAPAPPPPTPDVPPAPAADVAPAAAQAPPPAVPKPLVGIDALRSIPPEQANDAYKAGAWAPLARDLVPVSFDGQIGHVPADRLADAVDAGAEIIHPDIARKAELTAQGEGGAFDAAAAGLLRGASLGASDWLATRAAGLVGGEEQERLAQERISLAQEKHPYISTGAELTGAIVPGLVTGGAGEAAEAPGLLRTAARVLGSPMELAGKAGELVAGGVERAAGTEADSLLGRMVQHGISGAAKDATIGAIMGAGQQLSESSLDPNEDWQHIGEKLVSSIGHGAILNGALGATLGAGAEGISDLVTGARVKASPFLANQAKEQAFKAAAGGVAFTREAEEAFGPEGRKIVGEAVLRRGVIPTDGPITAAALSPDALLERATAGSAQAHAERNAILAANAAPLAEVQGQQAWDALDTDNRLTREAQERVKGGTAAVGNVLHEYGLVPPGPMSDPAAMVESIEKAKNAVGAQKGDTLTASGARVAVKPLHDDIEGVIGALEKMAGFEPVVNALRQYQDSLYERLGVKAETSPGIPARKEWAIPTAFEPQREQIEKLIKQAEKTGTKGAASAADTLKAMGVERREIPGSPPVRKTNLDTLEVPVSTLFEQKKALGDLVYKEAKALDPNLRVENLRQIRAIMADHETQAVAEAYEKAGDPDMRAKLEKLNHDYQSLSIAEKAAERNVSRYATNPALAEKAKVGTLAGLDYDQVDEAARKLNPEAKKALLEANQDARALDLYTRASQKSANAYATNRNAGLSEYMAMGAAAASGHLLAAPIVGFIHKQARMKGNALLAATFDRLSVLQSIAKKTAAVDADLQRGVKAFVKRASGKEAPAGSPAPSRPSSAHAAREEFQDTVTKLQAAAQHNANFHAPAADIAGHAPNVAQAFGDAARKAAAWLLTKVPPTPQFGSKTPSDQAVWAFNETARAVDDPAGTLARGLADGNLSRRQVEAVQATAPKIYDSVERLLQAQMAKALATDKTVPWEVRQQMATVFQLPPSDWSLTPGGIKVLQSEQPPANDTEAGAGQAPSKRSKPTTTPESTNLMTSAQRREGGQVRET
jgi:hypothetical protein